MNYYLIKKNSQQYAHVKSRLDTGKSMSKMKLISMREYIKRKMEIFKRITAKQLAELLEDNNLLDSPDARENEGKDDGDGYYSDEEDKKSVSNGRTYLVLDLRDRERFTACHIYGAMNFPARMLRSDRTRDLYKYKNRMRDDGFCFIVYDNEERIAIDAAKSLVEKGNYLDHHHAFTHRRSFSLYLYRMGKRTSPNKRTCTFRNQASRFNCRRHSDSRHTT